LTVADDVSPLAAAVGAANTLVLGDVPGRAGRRVENTDVAGLVEALREAGVQRVEQAVILGAGGTAQGALAALRELGEQAPGVLDVVYAPWPTPFAARAAATGCRVVSGLAVLLYQAVAQVELMTGQPGPVGAMRTALEEAARARR